MVKKDLTTWLDYIQTIHQQAIDMGLTRINIVAESLALKKFNCPVIVVAGTNGKGSCVALLEQCYLLQDYRVGSFTSPQLIKFNEQIRINGINVSDEVLIAAFERIESARGHLSLTLFEFTTLAALSIFKHTSLDVMLLEVGMGGRDDAVNCVDADLSIVTAIDLDHIAYLGDTREAIALHKAGIFRPHKPAVCGDAQPPATLLNYATTIQTDLFVADRDFHSVNVSNNWDWYFQDQLVYQQLPSPQLGQSVASTALMAITLLQSVLPVMEKNIRTALKETKLLGRFSVIAYNPFLIVDVAHNVAACENLVKKVKHYFPQKKVNAVCGMLKDKDIENCLANFLNVVQQWFVADLSGPRGEKAQRLENFLKVERQTVRAFSDVTTALRQCKKVTQKDEIILVFGSFLTVGEVLSSHKYSQN